MFDMKCCFFPPTFVSVRVPFSNDSRKSCPGIYLDVIASFVLLIVAVLLSDIVEGKKEEKKS